MYFNACLVIFVARGQDRRTELYSKPIRYNELKKYMYRKKAKTSSRFNARRNSTMAREQ